ncbi:hypothetical protein C8R47DRAFT_262245 [Mycena vitilis]|nr:hypothetical protein C8R47DRAFT_262245 [Mycena vitilis]
MHDSPQGIEHPRRPIDNRESSDSEGNFSDPAPVRVTSTGRREQRSRPSQSHSSREVRRPSGQNTVPLSPPQNATPPLRVGGHALQTAAASAADALPSPPASPETRWWFSPSGLSDADLYVMLMLKVGVTRGKGYPMWCPSPNSAEQVPIPHRKHGISLGDVGLVTPNGGFDFMFNIFAAKNDPLNGNGKNVPDGFSPCSWSHDKRKSSMPAGTTVSSPDIDVAVGALPMLHPSPFHFKVRRPPGALCALPTGADIVEMANPDELQDYIGANAMSWYRYFSEVKGRTLGNGGVYVITGTTKADSWGLFAIDDVPGAQGTRPVFRPLESHPWTYHWVAPGLGFINVRGVHDEFQDEKNQAVFITGFTVSLGRKWFEYWGSPDGARLSRIEKAIRPMQVSQWVPFSARGQGGGGRGRAIITSTGQSTEAASQNSQVASSSNAAVPERSDHRDNIPRQSHVEVSYRTEESGTDSHTQVFHPADSIHEYIRTELPSCDIVITHDSQWMTILEDKDRNFPDSNVLLDRILQKYQPVLNAGTAGFELKPGVDASRLSEGKKSAINYPSRWPDLIPGYLPNLLTGHPLRVRPGKRPRINCHLRAIEPDFSLFRMLSKPVVPNNESDYSVYTPHAHRDLAKFASTRVRHV